MAVHATANQPPRPRDIMQLADRLHGVRLLLVSPNCLRTVSGREDGAIERLWYGTYRLRRIRLQHDKFEP